MATTRELNAAMEATLKSAGIDFESVRVFGVIRQNVHVKCVSRETAVKWVALLSESFKDAKVSMMPSVWNAADNRGTILCPTVRKGFLVAVTA